MNQGKLGLMWIGWVRVGAGVSEPGVGSESNWLPTWRARPGPSIVTGQSWGRPYSSKWRRVRGWLGFRSWSRRWASPPGPVGGLGGLRAKSFSICTEKTFTSSRHGHTHTDRDSHTHTHHTQRPTHCRNLLGHTHRQRLIYTRT